MGDAARKSFGTGVLGAVLSSLPVVLCATPFYIATQSNPALSPLRYYFIAGLMAGIAVLRLANGKRRVASPKDRKQNRPLVWLLGALMVVCLVLGVLPEWLIAPLGQLSERAYSLFGTTFYVSFSMLERAAQPAIVFLASVSASFFCSRAQGLAPRTGATAPEEHTSEDSSATEDNLFAQVGPSTAEPLIADGLFGRGALGGACVGYLLSLLMCALSNLLMRVPYSLPLSLAAQFGLLVVGLLTWYLLLREQVTEHDLSATLGRPSSVVCLGLALGALAWQLLTRVLPANDALDPAYIVLGVVSFAILMYQVRLSTNRLHTDGDGASRHVHCSSAVLSSARSNLDRSFVEQAPIQTGGSTQTSPCAAATSGEAGQLREGSNPQDASRRELLASYGLAPRELEVATAFVSGKATKDIAAQLGIKPATVRATMQRVYHKAGVSSKEELLLLVNSVLAQRNADDSGSSAVEKDVVKLGAEGRCGGTRIHDSSSASIQPASYGVRASSRTYLRCVVLTLLCLVCLPVLYTPLSWGAARPLIYGCGIALLCGGPLCCWRRARPALLLPGLLLLMASFVLVRLAQLPALLWWTVGPTILGVLCSPSVVVLCSYFGTLMACCGALCCEPSPGCVSSGGESGRRAAGPSPIVILVMLAAAFGIGFCWEELWRGTAWFNVLPELVPFCLLVIGGSACVEVRQKSLMRPSVLVVLTVLCLLLGFREALWVIVACCALSTMLGATCHHRKSILVAMGSALALGALAGDFLVNLWGQYLVGNDIYTLAFGGRVAFGVFVSYLVTLASSVIGILFALACWGIVRSKEHDATGALDVTENERIRYSLMGRGLNQTQVDVAVDILAGLSSSSIASSRHYSRGTVNSARDAVYKSLGVHSRTEFVDALHQLSGL